MVWPLLGGLFTRRQRKNGRLGVQDPSANVGNVMLAAPRDPSGKAKTSDGKERQFQISIFIFHSNLAKDKKPHINVTPLTVPELLP